MGMPEPTSNNATPLKTILSLVGKLTPSERKQLREKLDDENLVEHPLCLPTADEWFAETVEQLELLKKDSVAWEEELREREFWNSLPNVG